MILKEHEWQKTRMIDVVCDDQFKWKVIAKEKFGRAKGIFIIHCLNPETCPCENFHECVGVYKLLKWDTWKEWRKENCVIKNL